MIRGFKKRVVIIKQVNIVGQTRVNNNKKVEEERIMMRKVKY